MDDPDYYQVASGKTGHAESIQIEFDPSVISYEDILKIFWSTHDPTTLNKQGYDQGTEYRSVIFYHSDEQKQIAEKLKQDLDKQGIFPGPIVTEIVPLNKFHEAENYHQDFYKNNPYQPYCQVIINPKLAKFRKEFQDKLK